MLQHFSTDGVLPKGIDGLHGCDLAEDVRFRTSALQVMKQLAFFELAECQLQDAAAACWPATPDLTPVRLVLCLGHSLKGCHPSSSLLSADSQQAAPP